VRSGDEVLDVGVESDEGDQGRHGSEETLVEKGA
jgi:hypothetical protein